MYPRIILIILCLVISDGTVSSSFSNDSCPNLKTPINAIRKKRYIAFPDKSNLILTLSAVKAFMTHVPAGWNMVLEIDVLYPLPDTKFVSQHSRKKIHHRQKRDFWNRLRHVLDAHNFNGEACLLRTICEAKYNLAPPGKSLVHDLLRAIFTAPIHERSFIEELGGEYNSLLDPGFCDLLHDCPFSLLHFLLDINKQKY